MKGFTPHHYLEYFIVQDKNKHQIKKLSVRLSFLRNGGGFTFIEFLLAMTIIAVLLTLTVPLGIRFYASQQLDTTTEEMVQALRRAQLKSMSQAEYSFGVYVGSGQSGQYVLFRGGSYGSNDDEEVFDVSGSISFSGLSEVVFSRLNGIPSVIGDIILTSENGTRIININQAGRMNYEPR